MGVHAVTFKRGADLDPSPAFSTGGLLVRPARPDEFDRLGEIVVAAYDGLGVLEGDEEYIPELRDVARRAGEAIVLAAVDEPSGDVLGCVTYVPDERNAWAEMLEPGEAGVRMLAVAPAAQGRGAGTALAEACVVLARADGRRRLCLHSLPQMTGAQRIYARLGFVREPARDWRYAPDGLLLAFALDLSPSA
jgi:ribosomal protein S18 acetylase RimI-like enzyme